MLLACDDDHWALSRNSRSIFSNSSTSCDFSKEIPSADIGKRTGLLSEETLVVDVTVADTEACSQEGVATFFVATEEDCCSAIEVLTEEEEVSRGFFVNIFWAAAAKVEIEWPPPALGHELDDPARGVGMAGNEVLGGRRLVKAAAAPCGSGRPPSAAVGTVAATPPTGGTRGAAVGTESVTTAGDGTIESSDATGTTWPLELMPAGNWACSGVTRMELG